jgi:hypothetical protein
LVPKADAHANAELSQPLQPRERRPPTHRKENVKTSPDEAIVRAGDFAERVRRNQQQLGAERTSLAE